MGATCQATTASFGLPCTRGVVPGQPYCYQHLETAERGYTVMLGVKVTEAQAIAIRQQAQADDRTVSSFLRRLLDWGLPLYAEHLRDGRP